MVKEISRTTWIIVIALFLVLTITIATITKTVQSMTHKEEIAVEINSEQIDTGIRLEKEVKSANTFTSYKTIPSTKIESIDKTMNKWAKEQEDAFYQEMEQTKEILDKNFVAHFNLQSDITKINDDLFSIEMKLDQAVEQDEEYTYVKTFFINIQTEEIIHMESLFNENNFTVQERIQLMEKHLDEDLDSDKWIDVVNDVNELQIKIELDAMTFYFNDKEVRNDNQVLQVEVPMKDMAMYLNEDYYSAFITEEMQAEIEREEKEEEEARKQETENNKYIALTFDDGPEKESTTRILETLNEYDAKATFFMLGKNAEQYPEVAKQVADEGHEIANHTVTHANLNAINRSRIEEEMTHSKEQIENATGQTPIIFRPPYGNHNDTVLEIAESTDQTIVLWSLDTYDWQHRNANATYQTIIDNVRPGSVILMHDIHQTTADALPKIMEHLSDEGYEFVTVSEILPYIEGEGIGPYYGQ